MDCCHIYLKTEGKGRARPLTVAVLLDVHRSTVTNFHLSHRQLHRASVIAILIIFDWLLPYDLLAHNRSNKRVTVLQKVASSVCEYPTYIAAQVPTHLLLNCG